MHYIIGHVRWRDEENGCSQAFGLVVCIKEPRGTQTRPPHYNNNPFGKQWRLAVIILANGLPLSRCICRLFFTRHPWWHAHLSATLGGQTKTYTETAFNFKCTFRTGFFLCVFKKLNTPKLKHFSKLNTWNSTVFSKLKVSEVFPPKFLKLNTTEVF